MLRFPFHVFFVCSQYRPQGNFSIAIRSIIVFLRERYRYKRWYQLQHQHGLLMILIRWKQRVALNGPQLIWEEDPDKFFMNFFTTQQIYDKNDDKYIANNEDDFKCLIL